MTAPAANVSGHWDVEIEFFSGTGRHALFLEQEGNWIRGSHQGEFSVRDLEGTIDGDQIRLRSIERRPGSLVTFIFAGTIAGDTVTGPIYMGEYLNATFTAKRHAYSASRSPIRVPSGRPLAT